ncbi:MAG: hypothetical protein V4858_14485 [Pseudomonadota bacterium]
MLASEKLAIAAHLHVLLRRKTGRVTDTQWMADNAEYAAEIVRFSRRSAEEDGHTELLEWADKLELAMLAFSRVPQRATPARATANGVAPTLRNLLNATSTLNNADTLQVDNTPYVRGLR